MQNETLILLAIIGASLQVAIQILGIVKAYLEWKGACKTAKGSDRVQRSKPKKKRKPK